MARFRARALVASGSVLVLLPILSLSGGTASADTPAYEWYCPHTPVGSVVINDVTTTGTMMPLSPTKGQAFSIANYQVRFALPSSIVSAAEALGNTVISGSLTSMVHVTGATPGTVRTTSSFTVPIPDTIAPSGLSFALPAAATTVGPFTAKGKKIVASVKSPTQLTLSISGSSLALRCRAYRDNVLPTGIVRRAPNRYPATPVIARNT